MNRHRSLLATVSIAAMLAGCATTTRQDTSPVGPAPVAINTDYKMGDIDIGDQSAPSLDDLVNALPQKTDALPDSEDKLRAPAMRDAALAYGAQGGLASISVEINRNLKDRASELSHTYDFSRLVIKGPDGAMVLPPVISEARDTWEAQDEGKALRVADKYYEIISQSRFTPTAPLWHSYLIRQYALPKPPPDALLPKDDAERKYWATYVKLGWDMGANQARDIFQSDLRRLERDFTGMVRYKQLLDQKLVSAPVIADTNLGVTGSDTKMRVNDRAVRITQDPKLNLDARTWRAIPSAVPKEEAATPPGKTFIAPKPEQDVENLEPQKTTKVETEVTYQAPIEPARFSKPRARQISVAPASIAPQPAPMVQSAEQNLVPDAIAAPAPAKKRYF